MSAFGFELPGVGVTVELSRHMPPGSWSIIGKDGHAIPVVFGIDGRAISPPVKPDRIAKVLCAPDIYERVIREHKRRERLAREPLDLKATRQ